MQRKLEKPKNDNAWNDWEKERTSKLKEVDLIHKYMSTLEKMIQDHRDQNMV